MLCGTVFADKQSSLVFSAACGGSGTASDGAVWTVTSDGTESNFDKNKGIHYGTGSAVVEYIKLSTSDIAGTITKVVVNASTASGVSATVDVTVGGNAFGGNAKSLSTTATDYTFEGSASGEINVNVKKPSSAAKALYVKSIVVTYAEATPEPQPYTYDFNTSIATSNHGFILGSNWGHVVGSGDYDGYGPYYMSYSYTADDGFNGTGSLQAYRQYAGDSQGGTVCYDLLVTPLVSGKITMKVKASSSASSSNPSFVEVYKIDAAGTTRGDLIQRFTESEGYTAIEGQEDWKEITLTLTEEQRIAIRAQYVYLDDFTAAVVNIIPQKSLTVNAVMNSDGFSNTQGTNPVFEQQADGTMKVVLKVTLNNSGDVDLKAGQTENYTLTVGQASSTGGSKTFYEEASIAIPEDIAAGEKKTFDVTFYVPYVSGYKYWFIKENITGTISSTYRYATSAAYEPKFVFRKAESSETSSLSGIQAYGLISEMTTKNFEIANTGIAPLTIKSITLPAGFTSANMPVIPEGGLVIAKGTTQALDITLPATPLGNFADNLTIVYLDKDGAEKTFTLAFTGNVLPAGTWAVNFDNTSNSPAYPAGSIAESGINSDYSYNSGTYEIFLKGRTASSYADGNNKFITPKLHATAGQQLTFDIKGAYGDAYYAKVFVSADRKNWGEPVAYFTYGEKEGAVAIGSSDWTTKSITFDTEGDYYVAFALYGEFKIDNIIGLTKVDVAHDLYIKSVNWPDASIKSGTAQAKPSVDIIPLTDEVAGNYTVKYIYGENVVNIESKDLTASVSSSTTFTASFTPTVETTTAFPGSKVVFEFTDGTKYETEGFDLTVTNEAIFHFLDSKPSSKWYEPTDRTAPIRFGKVKETTNQTFTIFNWGSAPLTVNSISLPEGFSTTTEFPFTVAAFNGENDGIDAACQTLAITLSATEANTYSGDMVITYSGDKTFTLPISGTMLDATKFYANFNDQNWPAGTAYQDNVSISYFSTGDYGLQSSSATKNLFITPKLTATEGDVLQFDASTRNSSYDGTVKMYISSDRETWAEPVKEIALSKTENTSKATYEYQFASAGDYYVAFELNEARVDDIYGLKLAEVAHDWKIASANIPAEAMQNVASTAIVNILNLGIANEAADSYTVTAYINNQVAGTGTAIELPTKHKLSDAGTQLAVNFQSPKVGTFPVYIEVKAGDYKVVTEPVDVVFTEEVLKSELTAQADGTSSSVPLNLSYYNSESVSLFPANVLTGSYGLSGGAKIKSIVIKGYKTTSETSSTLNVWYEWTDDATQIKPADGLYPTDGLTQIITDQTQIWPEQGSATELVDFITLTFNEPIAYEEGKALRLVVRSNSDQWKSANFEKGVAATNNLAYYHQNDNEETFNSNSWNSSVLPVLHISLEAVAATISGTVKNSEGAAIENATVTLVSTDGANVQYEGKTDAEGAYSFNVIQTGRTYNATVVATEEYKTATAEISFAEGSVIKDFVLADTNPLGDANLDGEVTTSDAVAAVTFALEKEVPSEKALKVADVNKSGNITVSDAVGIVNIALNAETPAPARGEMEAVNFLTKNGTSLNLINSTEFVGFQMDVTLAEGAMLNSVSLNDRAANLQVVYNRIAKNTYRIIAFSTDNAAIEGNEGELISLDITGNDNIAISNIEFADAAANAYALSLTEATGINGIYAGAANVESYTVGGVKNDKIRKGMNIVRTADGKVKKVLVK